jgi:hypothetical protein
MSNSILVIPDPHATPGSSNVRAEYLSNLITDIRPDVVVVMGDTADMPSLSSYDKGTKAFVGKSYAKDIEAHADFQDRMWSRVKKSKKKLPRRVTLIGNHEQRISRAVNLQPELEGTITYKDLELEHWYNDIVYYVGATPGSITIDGICFAHFIVSGNSGRPISGQHHAYSLLAKQFTSCVVGHSHTLDYSVRTRADGRKIHGLVSGCFVDGVPSYAGLGGEHWWRGVCLLRDANEGNYDLQMISMKALQDAYGKS